MNAQNSDSSSHEIISSGTEAPEMISQKTEKHAGILDTFAGLWHKKNPEKDQTIQQVLTADVPVKKEEGAKNSSTELENSQEHHLSVKEKIAHIFHKKDIVVMSEQVQEIKETTGSSPEGEGKEPEVPFVADEKFVRLLKHDSVYHSMIRSEDIKNIQLQLSMRYMLLMLAIFVVIAWVVNNRVIMFGFSDFPLLARSRDALFVILTGLFSLTVWFGATVWFRHRVGVILLRIIGGVLFLIVLVSVYLPFWRQ